ncbi:MAG: hypothetical protein HYZ29_13120 [Myxococcales bacterium]|nr:hypothetical protein [Myxococcales bacterium]
MTRIARLLGLGWMLTELGCSATAASESAPGAASGDAGSGSGGSLALGPGAGGGGGGAAATCTNVDLLFVVDNSGSMADQQQSLIASFDGFVKGIRDKLSGALSYHVGVVSTDDYGGNAPGCTQIGSLVTRTGGIQSSNQDCGPFASSARFLDATEPDLAGKFACAAKVGVGGADDERPMRAMLNALRPEMNAPGACNAGFSRLDSLLIVVLITDEDDVPDQCESETSCATYGSGGNPQSWYDEIVAHKGGVAKNIVVLSLIGRKADNACGAQVAAKHIGFANRFGDNGHIGDVCAPSYDGFFSEVLPAIETACKNYEPPK